MQAQHYCKAAHTYAWKMAVCPFARAESLCCAYALLGVPFNDGSDVSWIGPTTESGYCGRCVARHLEQIFKLPKPQGPFASPQVNVAVPNSEHQCGPTCIPLCEQLTIALMALQHLFQFHAAVCIK